MNSETPKSANKAYEKINQWVSLRSHNLSEKIAKRMKEKELGRIANLESIKNDQYKESVDTIKKITDPYNKDLAIYLLGESDQKNTDITHDDAKRIIEYINHYDKKSSHNQKDNIYSYLDEKFHKEQEDDTYPATFYAGINEVLTRYDLGTEVQKEIVEQVKSDEDIDVETTKKNAISKVAKANPNIIYGYEGTESERTAAYISDCYETYTSSLEKGKNLISKIDS